MESFLGLVGPWPAHLLVVVWAIPLAAIDQATHRLPDVIVLPLWGFSGGFFLVLAERAGQIPLWVAANVSMAIAVLVLWIMAELPGQPLGFGDVKLGGLIALHLGWHGPHFAVLGITSAFIFGGLWVLVAGLMGKIGWRDEVAFGPWLIAGLFFGLSMV